MRTFRHTAVLIAFAIAMSARVSIAAPDFYTNLLRRGIGEFNAGRYASASTLLRTAAFGLLDSIDQFETAQTYIAVASQRLGREDDARQATRRILQAERIQRRFAALPFPPELRVEFDAVAGRYLTGAEHAALNDATTAIPGRQGESSVRRRTVDTAPPQTSTTAAQSQPTPAAKPQPAGPPTATATAAPRTTTAPPPRKEEPAPKMRDPIAKPAVIEPKPAEKPSAAQSTPQPAATPTPAVPAPKVVEQPAPDKPIETPTSRPAVPSPSAEPSSSRPPAKEAAPTTAQPAPVAVEPAPQPPAVTPSVTRSKPVTAEATPEAVPAGKPAVATPAPAIKNQTSPVAAVAEAPKPTEPKAEPTPAPPQPASTETPRAAAATPKPATPAPTPEAVREAQREFERKVAEVEREQKVAPRAAPPRDVTRALQDAAATLDKGDIFGARAQLRAIFDAANLERADILRIAEEAYRAQDFALATDAFARAGALQKGEEALGYYLAVALYETGRYGDAKAALKAALPYIEVTEAVARYRAKIEGAVDQQPDKHSLP